MQKICIRPDNIYLDYNGSKLMICFSEKSAHFYAIALLQDFGHITFADRYKFFYAAVNGTPEPHIFRLFRWYVSFNSDHSPDDSPAL